MKIHLPIWSLLLTVCISMQLSASSLLSTDENEVITFQTDSTQSGWTKFVCSDSTYIDTLLLIQRQTVDKRNGVEGFRVQISSGKKSLIDNDNKKFLSIFPEVQTIRKFKTPDFILQAGNFRTRSEALKALSQIEKVFPSAFVIKETIDFPVLAP